MCSQADVLAARCVWGEREYITQYYSGRDTKIFIGKHAKIQKM